MGGNCRRGRYCRRLLVAHCLYGYRFLSLLDDCGNVAKCLFWHSAPYVGGHDGRYDGARCFALPTTILEVWLTSTNFTKYRKFIKFIKYPKFANNYNRRRRRRLCSALARVFSHRRRTP